MMVDSRFLASTNSILSLSRIEARGVDDCCTSVGIYLDVLGYLLIFIADNKELYGLAGTVHHLVEHEAAYV